MEEVWKDIDGYEGLYQISNFGNVKSLDYKHRGYSQNLVPKKNNSGRLWVELAKDGVRKQYLIHRLVGLAFIENPENLPQINHKDENPQNNRADNLEWCTAQYNMEYTRKRHPEKYGKGCKRVRKNEGKNRNKIGRNVVQMDMEGNEIKVWADIATIMNETGMSSWSISECCDGKRKKAYGFRWQYAI